MKQDETNSNKNVFIDQQKMAVEHLQKHLPDIEKSITQQKNAKAILPSLSVVRSKVKEYMAENAQKVEPKKEPVKAKPEEETKTVSKPQEASSPTREKSASQNETNKAEDKQEGRNVSFSFLIN